MVDGEAADLQQRESPRQSLLALLLRRSFFPFWFGQGVSWLGNAVFDVVLGWTVYQVTGSTAALGAVLALNAVPNLLFLLFGGAVADRLPRRLVIQVADGAAGAVVLGLALAAATGGLSLPILMAAAFLLGTLEAFYGPAYQAITRDLVDRGELRSANALVTATSGGARMLGPAAAGIVYAWGGAGLAFAVDGASFLVAVAAMTTIRSAGVPARDETGGAIWSEIAEGFRYTLASGWLLVIIVISIVVNVACMGPVIALLPALVGSAHGSVGLLGLLTSAQVAASIVGAVVIGRWPGGLRPGPALLVLATAVAAGTIALGLSAGAVPAMLLGVVLVGAGLSFGVVEMTVLQARVPPGLLSRVISINMVTSFALLPAGLAAGGLAGALAGIPATLIAGGAVTAAVLAGVALTPAARGLDR